MQFTITREAVAEWSRLEEWVAVLGHAVWGPGLGMG
jgi:hypothetical protein